jgi:GNAT superfamily N-acetyltransferase
MNWERFNQTIYQNWANHFGCSLATFHQSGTTILPVEKYAGEKIIVLWHIGNHSFAQLDPGFARQVERLLGRLAEASAISGGDLQRAWGARAISSHDIFLVYYLYPQDLPGYALPAPFVLRQLTEADGGLMQALHNANSPEDVDEGYVEVSHQIIYGCFAGEQLVAAASGYERAGFMDIGVLTHPGFRRKGLGKAVVGAICDWSSVNGYIAQYRFNEQNKGSRGIADGLNFRSYFSSEGIWMASP